VLGPPELTVSVNVCEADVPMLFLTIRVNTDASAAPPVILVFKFP
jgi:hypothetical protein